MENADGVDADRAGEENWESGVEERRSKDRTEDSRNFEGILEWEFVCERGSGCRE